MFGKREEKVKRRKEGRKEERMEKRDTRKQACSEAPRFNAGVHHV